MQISELSEACFQGYFYSTIDSEDGLTSLDVTESLDGKRDLLVFRGTDQILDWICTDLRFSLSQHYLFGSEKVKAFAHSGFLNSFEDIEDELLWLFESMTDPVFTGHSLGGAIALLSAHYYKTLYPLDEIKVVTFGSPKIGNKVFNQIIEETIGKSNILNVYNPFDLVPKLPLPHHFGYQMLPGNSLHLKSSWCKNPHHILKYHSKLLQLDISI